MWIIFQPTCIDTQPSKQHNSSLRDLYYIQLVIIGLSYLCACEQATPLSTKKTNELDASVMIMINTNNSYPSNSDMMLDTQTIDQTTPSIMDQKISMTHDLHMNDHLDMAPRLDMMHAVAMTHPIDMNDEVDMDSLLDMSMLDEGLQADSGPSPLTLEQCIALSADELWLDQDEDSYPILNPLCEPFREDIHERPKIYVPFYYFSNVIDSDHRSQQSSIYNDINWDSSSINLSGSRLSSLESWSFESLIRWPQDIKIESVIIWFLIENPHRNIVLDYEIYYGTQAVRDGSERDDMIELEDKTIHIDNCLDAREYPTYQWCPLNIPTAATNHWQSEGHIRNYFIIHFDRFEEGGSQQVAHMSSTFRITGLEDCNDDQDDQWINLTVDVDQDHDYYPANNRDYVQCIGPFNSSWSYPRAREDCDDRDPQVHPTATYQVSPRPNGSFDWNCDGFISSEQLLDHGECGVSISSDTPCSYTSSILNAECGESVLLNRCIAVQDTNTGSFVCSSLSSYEYQRCR